MQELFMIHVAVLRRIFSVAKTELNTFELAIRDAIEAANSTKELKAILENDQLEDTLPMKIGTQGRLIKKV